MADAITPAVQEMEESLKNIDKVLTSSAKETFLLKKELIGINSILGTKNWEILSRFLSGTGAWRVLNKFKASILMMVQLASIQERAALAEAENMKRMAEVAKDRNELIKIETALRNAQTKQDEKSLQKLRDMSDLFTGLELMYGAEVALDKLAAKTKKQITIMEGIISSVVGKKKDKGTSKQFNAQMESSKGILQSNVLQTAALTTGFALNARFLKHIQENTLITKQMLEERQLDIDTILTEFEVKWIEAEGGSITTLDSDFGGQSFTNLDKDKEKMAYLLEQSEGKYTKVTATMEELNAELGIAESKLGKWSVAWNRVIDSTTGKWTGFVDENLHMNYESYKLEKENLDWLLKVKKESQEAFLEVEKQGNVAYSKMIDEKIVAANFKLGQMNELGLNIDENYIQDTIDPFMDMLNLHGDYAEMMFIVDEQYYQGRASLQDAAMDKERRVALKNIWEPLGETDEELDEREQNRGKFVNTGEKFVKRREKLQATFGNPINKLKKSFLRYGSISKMWEMGKKKVALKALKLISFIVGWAKKTLIYGTLLLGVLFLLYTSFKNSKIRESISEVWTKALAFFSFYVVPWLEVIGSGIRSIIDGFQEGNFFKVLEGVFMIVGGLIMASIAFAVSLLNLALGLIGGYIMGLIDWFKTSGASWSKKLAVVGYIASALLFLVAFFMGGWVITLVAAIILGISYLLEKLNPFADGGTTTNGLSLVGEKGPELVKLPVGSRVYSNANSQKMLSAGGSNATNITVQVQGRIGASDMEIREMADKVAREINLRINRTSAAVTKFG